MRPALVLRNNSRLRWINLLLIYSFRQRIRCACRWHLSADGDDLYRGDEPIPAARESLHKPRIVGRVVESLTEPLDGCVQAMFKIHKGVCRPELAVKLFARSQLAGVLEQTNQNRDRLPFQPDLAALLLKFARTQIKLEDAEPNRTREWYRWAHCLIRTESNTSSRDAHRFLCSCHAVVELALNQRLPVSPPHPLRFTPLALTRWRLRLTL